MKKKLNFEVARILINYKKLGLEEISEKEGIGWITKQDFLKSFLKDKTNAKRELREWQARGYLKLQHPFIEVRSKKSETLIVGQKRSSGYRFKRNENVWKELYLFFEDYGCEEEFLESDYNISLKDIYEKLHSEFKEIFKREPIVLPDEFHLFLQNKELAKEKASILANMNKARSNEDIKKEIKERIQQEMELKYRAEYEKLIKIAKNAMKLAKKK